MSRRLTYPAVLAAVVATAAALVWIIIANGSSDGGEPSARTQSQATGIGVDLSRRDSDDPRAIGDVDAPVVLIEYADFRCPFCGVFARDTEPELSKYVEDGTLRIEFRDLPIFGGQSDRAAVASRAAASQGKFWEFYRAVYEDAPERGHADLPDDTLLDYAREIGVKDMERFEKDMNAASTTQAVQADAQEAYQIGASSTPLFLVNDEPILGAQPTDVFVEKIERLAAAK